LRLQFESEIDKLKLAAFLPDHGQPASFSELWLSKFLASLFSFNAADKTNGLQSVASTYAGKNLQAIYLARQAVKRGDLREAIFVLERDTAGEVKECAKGWVSRAREVAESKLSREFEKALVYSRLSQILV
jgi:hypothetical protein